MQTVALRYLLFSSFFAIIHKVNSCARSEVGLSRLPFTEEIAGSNPVGPAKIESINHPSRDDFLNPVENVSVTPPMLQRCFLESIPYYMLIAFSESQFFRCV